MPTPKMKYLSLFSGAGGFELGIEQAYGYYRNQRKIQTKSADGESLPLLGGNHVQEPLCIGFSEIDKYANQLLSVKWPTIKNYGDAKLINETDLPDFDLLVGGFPCQSFSVAGKRKGFDDTRGTLFFDIARILAHKKPRYLVLENVKGLLSHDGGRTFQTIIRVLTDLGYFIEWQVLNSKNFGVPQNRERVFIVGYLGGEPRPQVFLIGGTNTEDSRIIGQDVAYTIDANYHKGTNTLDKSRRSLVQLNHPRHSNDRVYSTLGIGPTLNTMQGGMRQPLVATSPKIRRLTPLECERLQGFPDNWTWGFSDTQRYKMMGNAVTVNTVREVIFSML